MDWLVGIVALLAVFDPGAEPCRALDGLDVRRAIAWQRGDRAVLAEVYAGDSDDVRRLDAYLARDIRVAGLRMERASCIEDGGRLRVVERVVGAVAVLPDGSRRALPRDAWSERFVTLGFVDGAWRITAVEPR